MRTLTVIQTTVNDQLEVNQLVNGLLEEKLVACAQVSNIQSSYWWKGEIDNVPEFSILFKLPYENKQRVIEFIEKNHSYDVPEIIIEDKKSTERYFEYCHQVCDI
ncbi:MAG: divalent-cation tolerance protein CutA [Candidatus Heimdallarchaeota archaeon]|nr:divalent-cation tolerance protein CutA [Candidatus Heimdallarchaeota archaeon]